MQGARDLVAPAAAGRKVVLVEEDLVLAESASRSRESAVALSAPSLVR